MEKWADEGNGTKRESDQKEKREVIVEDERRLAKLVESLSFVFVTLEWWLEADEQQEQKANGRRLPANLRRRQSANDGSRTADR